MVKAVDKAMVIGAGPADGEERRPVGHVAAERMKVVTSVYSDPVWTLPAGGSRSAPAALPATLRSSTPPVREARLRELPGCRRRIPVAAEARRVRRARALAVDSKPRGGGGRPPVPGAARQRGGCSPTPAAFTARRSPSTSWRWSSCCSVRFTWPSGGRSRAAGRRKSRRRSVWFADRMVDRRPRGDRRRGGRAGRGAWAWTWSRCGATASAPRPGVRLGGLSA